MSTDPRVIPAEQRLADRDKAIDRVKEQLHHAEANGHHLAPTCQGVFNEVVPAVRISNVWAALADQPTEDGACSTCDGTGRVDWAPGQQRHTNDDQQPCPDCCCTKCGGERIKVTPSGRRYCIPCRLAHEKRRKSARNAVAEDPS